MSRRARPSGRRLRFEALEERRLLATFTVTNTQDSGAGSLRQAILDANGATEASVIRFQIPASDPNFIDVDAALAGGDAEADVWRIQPLSELPELTASVGIMIDGHTQSQFAGEPNPFGPEIVLDGEGLFARGLTIRTNDHTIRGLNIQDFGRSGIDLFGGDRVVIVGNYIGVDATGTLAAGNARWGINVNGDADNNRIGTDADTIGDASERNVIGGSGFGGIGITGADNNFNVVAGNYIGTNATATAKIGNLNHGVEVSGGGQFNRIGTNADGFNDAVEANVISGNMWSGVSLAGANTRNNVVSGNLIGTDGSGSTALGNSHSGIILFGGANQNLIGGSSVLARNVISGNTLSGVTVRGVGTSENRISANYIGINKAGAAALANESGVSVDSGATRNLIGTDGNGINDAAEGNVISGNSESGVVIEDAGTDENAVAGNLIGTTPLGTAKLGNKTQGVSIFEGAQRNRIGSNADGANDAVEGNVISGNLFSGVRLIGVNTSHNVVAGNFLGTDRAGSLDLGNSQHGVSISSGASLNRIGGAGEPARNLISGNEVGVVISAADGNIVAGNLIGTNASGVLALGNDFAGVRIEQGAAENTIGTNGDGVNDALEANLISGNSGSGVVLRTSSSFNVIAGNRIGIQSLGNAPLPNTNHGVRIENGSHDNRIGTNGDGVSDAVEANVLVGNAFSGVSIAGAETMHNVVAGNFVGTDATGTPAIGNSIRGIDISSGAQHNLIGTNADGVNDPAEGNVISGNIGAGVSINGASTSLNVVAGNFIGTDAAGAVALGNTQEGVLLFNGAASNLIGGSTAAARNIISGNLFSGIRITGAGVNNNHIAGNFIGLNAAGSGAIPNTSEGILLDGGPTGNIIGTNGDGVADGSERNVISGNGLQGVRLFGAGTSANVVAGNYIGTDAFGMAPLANGTHGVAIVFSASGNRIGTNGDGLSDVAERNVISANTLVGVIIDDEGTNFNVVAGNFIGLNANGSAPLPNFSDGVLILSGAASNRIGSDGTAPADAAARNIISGNGRAGVNIVGLGTTDNIVAGNSIGTDITGATDLGNGTDGVRFQQSAANNLTIGNTIAFNKRIGVSLSSNAGAGNALVDNSIYSNSQLGIDLGADGPTANDAGDADLGPNRTQNTPVIIEALVGPTAVRLTFSVSTAVENASYPLLVEFFLADASAQEGKTHLGFATFLASDFATGQKTVVFPPAAAVKAGDSVVATASDTVNVLQPANTSEFSEPATVVNNPWYNVSRPFAVNEIAGVFADDALDVINFLNAFGSVPVPVFAAGPPFYDTNGDFTVSAGDALDIINFLNAGFGGEGEGFGGKSAMDAVFGGLDSLMSQSMDGAATEAVLLTDDCGQLVAGSRFRRNRRI